MACAAQRHLAQRVLQPEHQWLLLVFLSWCDEYVGVPTVPLQPSFYAADTYRNQDLWSIRSLPRRVIRGEGVCYTLGVDKSFFRNNRHRLIKLVGAELVVLTGYIGMQWQGDSAAPFRQETNFWYLTGIEHANWRLVIDGGQGKSWLVAPEVDATHQVFDGSLDFATAKAISGVDEVLTQEAGKGLVEELTKKYSAVHTLGTTPYADYADFVLNPAPERLRSELKRRFSEVKDCRASLAKLRAIKQPVEVAAMKRAATLSIEAFEAAKAKLPSCRYEYEVEAELAYYFRRHNGTHAFEPIVASGKNACTLHYTSNASRLKPGELLLIDAGARVDGYPADITRTFAAHEPTERQAAVHRAVSLAEQQIIELLKPGLPLKSYLNSVENVMKDSLFSLGLMANQNDEAAYRRYFPHAVSHGLGIDVHESLGGFETLQPGMVLTVEPGIYIPEEKLGVRIEDTILITKDGHKNLTGSLSTDF